MKIKRTCVGQREVSIKGAGIEVAGTRLPREFQKKSITSKVFTRTWKKGARNIEINRS